MTREQYGSLEKGKTRMFRIFPDESGGGVHSQWEREEESGGDLRKADPRVR